MLFWAGVCKMFEHPLAKWTEKAILCAWASVWALATEIVFKQIFGRAWPEPLYIHEHLDGFRFFHASEQWMAFPSGHALNSFALATAIGLLAPRWRMITLMIATTISACMVVCNYHWLSDVIAGGFLGVAVGTMTVKLRAAEC